MTTDAQIAEMIPLDQLIELRQQGISLRACARHFNVRRQTLNRYARRHLPHHLYYIRRNSAPQRRCTRCSFLPEPRNPIFDDGQCLWCHVELNGLTLLHYHESGMAKFILDQLGT